MPSESRLYWLAVAGILAIYLLFPTRNYYWDGVEFARVIEATSRINASLIHPNHLIYNLFGYLVYRLTRTLGQARALPVLQATNSVLSALSAGLVFLLLRKVTRSNYISICMALGFACSATWWKFSTDVDAYLPSVLLLLCSFYLVLAVETPRPLLLAVVYTLSMCFHQIAVIAYPALALALYLQHKGTNRQVALVAVAEFTIIAFVLTLGAFYVCFHLVATSHDLSMFAGWLTSYDSAAGFRFKILDDLTWVVRGNVRLLLGGRLNALKGLLNGYVISLLLVLGIALPALVVMLIRHPIRLRKSWPTVWDFWRGPIELVAIVWTLSYSVFLFFWMPNNTFYRLHYLPALILIAGSIIGRMKEAGSGKRHYRLLLVVLVFALSNFLFLIYPYSRVERNPPLALALEMNKVWSPGTVIFYGQRSTDNTLFQYFNPQTLWKNIPESQDHPDELDLEEIDQRGLTVWLDVTAIKKIESSQPTWLADHVVEGSRRRINDPAYNVEFVRIRSVTKPDDSTVAIRRALPANSWFLFGERFANNGGN